MSDQPRGGTRLTGRRYYLRGRPVEVVTGWGPGATIRNVRIRYLDDDTEAVRPFRGLRLHAAGGAK